MSIFFTIMIALGALLIYFEYYGARHSDSMPTELAHHGNKGLLMVVAGIIGELCIWLWP